MASPVRFPTAETRSGIAKRFVMNYPIDYRSNTDLSSPIFKVKKKFGLDSALFYGANTISADTFFDFKFTTRLFSTGYILIDAPNQSAYSAHHRIAAAIRLFLRKGYFS